MEEDDVLAALEAATPAIVEDVLEATYRDPFWMARFGKRGREFTASDNRHHLDTLASAVVFGEAAMTDYARWLQGLLTTRGMCTLHIQENLETLVASVERRLPAWHADVCRPLLRAGIRALRYDGAAGVLVDLLGTVLTRFHEREARKEAAPSPAPLRHALQYYVSFLADAQAREAPDQLLAYLRWSAAFLGEGGIERRQVEEALGTLAAILEELPGLTAAARLLHQVLEQFRSEGNGG